MVPDPSPTGPRDTAPTDSSSSPVLNAVIGAVTGIVLSFVPLSPLLGGAVAGYLTGGEPEDGLRVGAYAGLLMLIPFALIGTVVAMFFLGFGTGGPPFAFGIVALFVLVLGAVYTVGLSILGGFLGVYLEQEL